MTGVENFMTLWWYSISGWCQNGIMAFAKFHVAVKRIKQSKLLLESFAVCDVCFQLSLGVSSLTVNSSYELLDTGSTYCSGRGGDKQPSFWSRTLKDVQTISQKPNLLRYWAVNDNRTRQSGTQENHFMSSPICILDVDVHSLCCSKELWKENNKENQHKLFTSHQLVASTYSNTSVQQDELAHLYT